MILPAYACTCYSNGTASDVYVLISLSPYPDFHFIQYQRPRLDPSQWTNDRTTLCDLHEHCIQLQRLSQ